MGHAISFLFHGDIRNSFHAHWLGIPALAVILYSVYALARKKVFQTVLLANNELISPL
jgi:hypothetical protein